jgi:hypothetical protein
VHVDLTWCGRTTAVVQISERGLRALHPRWWVSS